jgi:hypothetical protein
MSEVEVESQPVVCPLPECDEVVVEIGPATRVLAVCPCGAFLLISRNADGEVVRNEVITSEAES